IYGRMVRHHGDATLDKLYPRVRECLEPALWEVLVRDYLASRPARPFEMNQVGEGFAGFLGDEAGGRGLPDFLPALARFEWTDFAVYTSMEPPPGRVERLTVNPTLVTLEHPFCLCAFLRAGGGGRPEPGAELALLWRHPERLVTMFLAAEDRALLVLKMAMEDLSPRQVAEATGVDEAVIRGAVDTGVAEGLILAP
ncbi:MAG: putative DNA-binding domain-containing protein, partial [Cystobacter sp.]